MTYTTDGKCNVYAGKLIVARSYIGNTGYEVRLLQGMPKAETVEKIIRDCPDFARSNGLTIGTNVKLFKR